MSDNYLLPFDSLLPIEILYQIIQYVGIENLIQLLPIPVSPYLQSSFIHHNPNIKRAIDNLIVDSNITFNNRLVQHSLIHIYLRTRSYLQKTIFGSCHQNNQLYNYFHIANHKIYRSQ